jgi:aspartyl-tRNA(Asn)/glutamyl-tRNA(Gln) amidotransferase subunit C
VFAFAPTTPLRCLCAIVATRNFLDIAMPIDHATVRHIARLARIGVDDADVPRLAGELARVLDLADRLGGANLAGIEPMAHPHAQTLAWRIDQVSEPDRAEAFLALAPEARGGLYLVPKVIE